MEWVGGLVVTSFGSNQLPCLLELAIVVEESLGCENEEKFWLVKHLIDRPNVLTMWTDCLDCPVACADHGALVVIDLGMAIA